MNKILGFLKNLDVVINFGAVYRCDATWRMDSGWAKNLVDYDLWYVSGGLGRMTTSDGEVDIYPGQCVWMRPGRRYEATHDPNAPLRVIAIHFLLRNKAQLLRPSQFIPPVEVFEPVAPAYFEAAMSHIVDLRSRFGLPDVAVILFKSLLLEIATEKSRRLQEKARDRHHKLKINPVIAAIRDEPERRFSVTELAARAGYSADHFVRLFQAETGQSPKEFMIAQRMERAIALLKGSSHTVSQISDLLGYEDVGFFSRQFKENVGASPNRFRTAATSRRSAA